MFEWLSTAWMRAGLWFMQAGKFTKLGVAVLAVILVRVLAALLGWD